MTIWLTSDLHLQHKNIWQKFEIKTRPFKSQEEHDNILIYNWNKVVQPDDIVFVLGDFIMGAAENVPSILDRLLGKIFLIVGNHDTQKKIDYYKLHKKILGIENYYIFEDERHNINYVLNHYPICGDMKDQHLKNDGWKKGVDFFNAHKENSIYCYGHIHGNAPIGLVDNTFHVGVDTNNLIPVKLEKIVKSC